MLKLEHVGIAVEQASAAASTFEKLFGAVPYKHEAVIREGVGTSFVDAGGPKLELLQSTNDSSAIAKFLGKRGEGLHHIALEVDDIDAQFERVRRTGFTVLSDQPLAGADGKQIFFVHPRDCHGILVEFCQQVRSTWRNAEIEMPHGIVAAYSAGLIGTKPVLLLHDQGSSALEDFNELLPTLERSMHVMAYDAPGHGGARGWDAGTSILRAADKHARAVLSSYNVGLPAVILGRGLAATAAVHTAQSYPDLVQSLVLVDPVESIMERLEEACPDKPMLVCSFGSHSVELATQISKQFSGTRLAVIPEFEMRYTHLADQIVACGTWS